MTRDDAWQHSCMLICLGAAGAIVSVSWRSASPLEIDRQGFRVQGSPSVVSTPLPTAVSPTPTPQRSPSESATRLVVDLSDRRLAVYRPNQSVVFFPLGVGQPGWETPTGEFQVIAMQRYPRWKHPITGDIISQSPQNPLGTRWISFWSEGKHEIGFHGTNQQQSIGQAVSHGCLRMTNPQIEQLYEWVSVGTPVLVRP